MLVVAVACSKSPVDSLTLRLGVALFAPQILRGITGMALAALARLQLLAAYLALALVRVTCAQQHDGLAGVELAWRPLGGAIPHARVLALSATFNSSGTPVVAYGAADSVGDTTTRFLAWANGVWTQVAQHTPEFAQPYEHFNARAEDGFYYLGLAINPSDIALSSILRSGERAGGGDDGWVGAYAFAAGTFDFALTPAGNALTALTPDNATLQLSTYMAAGWNTYPGGNTWTPAVTVDAPAGGVDAIVAAQGGDSMIVAYAGAAGIVSVGLASLDADNSAWVHLGQPLVGVAAPADAPPVLAWDGRTGSNMSTLCVSAISDSGGLLVSCCTLTGKVHGVWTTPATAIAGVSPRLPPAIALLPSTDLPVLLVVAASEANESSLLAAACTLAAGPSPACVDWDTAALPPLVLPAAVNDFVLHAPKSGSAAPVPAAIPVLLAVSTGPADGTGDALQMLTVALSK